MRSLGLSYVLQAFVIGICAAQSPPSYGPSGSGLDAASAILNGYVSNGQLWNSRAARTSNCANNATSVACMACSQDLPAAAVANGVAPIAVANELWFQSARGAVCGTCFKVYMLPGTTTPSPGCPNPSDIYSGVDCAGQGTQPYATSVSNPLNYGAKVMYDPVKGLSYFIAMAIEWLDRNQTDDYTLAYPTQQTVGVDNFGSWPVSYEFLVERSYDGKNIDQSLGLTVRTYIQEPLTDIKLQITGQRIPIGAVDIRLQDGNWYSLSRSGDGYWETVTNGPPFIENANNPVDVRVSCVDGSPPKYQLGLIPAQMLCAYQDPTCQRFTGSIQC